MEALKNYNMLLLDADANNALVTITFFKRFFNGASHFLHSEDIVEYVNKNNNIDLIVVDLPKPTEECAELVVDIKNIMALNIPILILTTTQIMRGYSPCDCANLKIVLKPIDIKILFQAIKALLPTKE